METTEQQPQELHQPITLVDIERAFAEMKQTFIPDQTQASNEIGSLLNQIGVMVDEMRTNRGDSERDVSNDLILLDCVDKIKILMRSMPVATDATTPVIE